MSDSPYQPDALIAVGPSAKVYCGHHANTMQPVRLKSVLDPMNCGVPLDVETVRAEFSAWLPLRHPQIAAWLALDEQGQDITLVSELSSGVPMWEFLARRPLMPADARALASQLIMALQAGEMFGLPHGDVKPSNTMLTEIMGGGIVLQLTDWALDTCRADMPQETREFRAPELQHGGKPTIQGDLFSAGATLAAMILGHAPAANTTADHLRAVRPDFDPHLLDWIAWLLRAEPAERPMSAAHAQESLTAGAGFLAHPFPAMGYAMPPPMAMPMPAPVYLLSSPTGPMEPPRTPTTQLTPVRPGTAPMPRAPQKKSESAPAAEKPAKPKKPIMPKGAWAFNVIAFGLFFTFATWSGIGKRMWRIITSPPAPKTTITITSAADKSPIAAPGIKARFVKIVMHGKATLNIAEVEVFSGGRNIAPSGEAKALDFAWGANAERANDGNTSGDWKGKSIYHGSDGADSPWWEVDLRSEQPIDSVKVWARTDEGGKYADRLRDYDVVLASESHEEVWRLAKQPTPDPMNVHEVK